MTITIGTSPSSIGGFSYHSIVCDHFYMKQLGLSCFTLEDLREWLSYTDFAGNYQNVDLFTRFFNISGMTKDEIVKKAANTLLTDSRSLATTEPWRNFSNGGGRYEQYSDIFNFNNDGCNWFYDKYKWRDLSLNDFKDRKVVFGTQLGSANLVPAIQVDDKLSIIIEANNWVRAIQTTIPKSQWLPRDLALYEFINDIKSSKDGCIKWSNIVEFRLTIGNQVCRKMENVEFKLYLYDEKKSRDSSRKLAMQSIDIVGPKVDSFGRYGDLIDGVVSPPSINEVPQSQVAGKVALEWDNYNSQWVSGTPQSLVVLIEDLPASSHPSIVDFLEADILSLLSSALMIKAKTAKAVPLYMHNSNPKMWGPTYKANDPCNPDSGVKNEKFSITVINLSGRAYKTGETVLANKICGVWVVSDLGFVPEPEEVVDEELLEKRWDFMYLVTNSDSYFRRFNIDPAYKPQFSFIEYEYDFRHLYYKGDPLNDPELLSQFPYYSSEADWDLNNTMRLVRSTFQLTSWDFMGSNIGGNRGKNALGATNYGLTVENELPEENSAEETSPFFGCVFPDGYVDTNSLFAKYNSNHVELIASGSASGYINNVGQNIMVFQNNNANVKSNGMFFNAYPGGGSTLNHLPADIALNASPSGTNGSPIRSINDFDCFSWFNLKTSGDMVKVVEDFFLRPNYSWLANPSENSSVFDLKPVNKNKIQFRPMKACMYATFELDSIPVNQSLNQRGGFGAISWLSVNDQESPIAKKALQRNSNPTGRPNGISNLLIGVSGLKYNIDNYEPTLPPENSRFNERIWNREWMLDPERPAGAVGVIAARTSVYAKGGISFSTDNFIGMPPWLVTTGNILFGPVWAPSYGGYGGDNYFNFNTTQLHVRAYEAWPREQTIYDPRTFSIFHFNKGIGDYDPYYKYDIDIITPRYPNGSGLNLNDVIYNDTEFAPSGTWDIDISRRGKLLPYQYLKKTIGVGDFNSYIYDVSSKPSGTPLSYGFYIYDQGLGYSESDIFTTIGGNGKGVSLNPTVDNNGKITGFVVSPTSQTVSNKLTGYDFIHEDFENSYTELSTLDINDIKIQIVPKTLKSTGIGFKGGVLKGIAVDSPILTDKKPESQGVNPLYRLTPDSPSYDFRPSTFQFGEYVGPTSEKVSTFIPVNKAGNYDLFFYYHNDISHNIGSDIFGGQPSPENHVTLSITTS